MQAVLARLDDTAPVVRGTAIWALAKMDLATAQEKAAAYMALETDLDVLAEWQEVERA